MGEVVFKLSAEEGAAVNAFLKVCDAQKKTEQGFDSMGRASQTASAQAMAGIQQWATRLVGLSAAAAALRKIFAEMEAERQRGQQSIEGSSAGKANLLSLVGPGRSMAQMLGAVKASRREGLTSEEANSLQYVLEKTGQGGQRGLYTSLTGDRAGLATSVAQIQASMGPQAGDAYGILNRLSIAAGRSPVGREDMGKLIAGSAVQGHKAGSTAEELMAAVAVAAAATKSEKEASSYTESMNAIIAEKGYGGRHGLVAGVQDIAGRGWSDKRLRKQLGGAYEAYGFWSQHLGEVAGAKDELLSRDALKEQWAAREGSAELRTERAGKIASQTRKLMEEKEGYEELEDQMSIDRAQILLKGQKASAFSRAGLEAAFWVGEKVSNVLGLGSPSAVEKEQTVRAKAPAGLKVQVSYDRDPNAGTE